MTDDTSGQDRKRAGIAGVISGGGVPPSGIEATAIPEQPGSTAHTLRDHAGSADLGATAQDLSRLGSTVTATPSSACSDGSRTFAVSQPGYDRLAGSTSSPQSVSPLPCATGYETPRAAAL